MNERLHDVIVPRSPADDISCLCDLTRPRARCPVDECARTLHGGITGTSERWNGGGRRRSAHDRRRAVIVDFGALGTRVAIALETQVVELVSAGDPRRHIEHE